MPSSVVHVLSMFRNNENYLLEVYIPRMTRCEERNPHIEFVYHIIENDSTDNTRNILWNFIGLRNDRSMLHLEKPLECEYVNKPSGKNYSRITVLANIRNTLVDRALSTMKKDEWALFIDSNIHFNEDTLDRLLECDPLKHGYGALIPYTQQLLIPHIHPVKHPCLKSHYYDTYSLYNKEWQSYWPYCGFTKCEICDPMSHPLRKPIPAPIEAHEITEIASGFSGYCLILTDILMDKRCRWSTMNYDCIGDEGTCEHAMFFKLLRVLTNYKVGIAQNVDNVYRTY